MFLLPERTATIEAGRKPGYGTTAGAVPDGVVWKIVPRGARPVSSWFGRSKLPRIHNSTTIDDNPQAPCWIKEAGLRRVDVQDFSGHEAFYDALDPTSKMELDNNA